MKIKQYLAVLLTAAMLLPTSAAFAEDIEAGQEESVQEDAVVQPQHTVPNFTMPTNQRATIITPTVDFMKEESYDRQSVEEELDALYLRLSEIGLNTVYINTVYNENSYFNVDMNENSETDYIALTLEKASQYNIRSYLIYDMNYVLSNCEENTEPLDNLISVTHRFVLKYPCDGIVVNDYYSAKSCESYGGYMQTGSGIGYDNWLYDTNELYFSAVSDVIHMTDNSIPVGILINDAWANASSNEEGSETEDPIQALYDGFADTKNYIEQGYADFCVVNAYGSISSSVVPFEAVTGWWDALASEYSSTMYVIHHNERLGGADEGWGEIDQILRQLVVADELSSFGGSVFNSCEDLLNDEETTSNIMKFYGDELNEKSLFEDLYMQSPSQLSFTTYEPYVDFMGTFDENFEVLFNGEPVVLNSAGNFYFEEPLEIGSNTFTFEHKGKVYTYKIERKVTTLKSLDSSIENGKTLSVTGSTRLDISCTAYKGSYVTATLNGKTVELKQSDTTQDADINSSYATFRGTYTVPDGIIGSEQELGTLLVTASYSGYTESLYGASIKVLALPEPPKEEIKVEEIENQDTAGSGEVVGRIDPIHSDTENVQYVRVSNDYTMVYNGATAGSIPTPDYAQLPAGTLDYLLTSSGDYYITESGKRLKKTAATSFSDTGLGTNALFVKSTGTYNGSSYIRIQLDYKISYNITLVGNNYFSGGDGDFNLYDFTANQLYITFDNVTSVTKLPSFEHNYVFSAGKWETVTVDGIPKFRLILTLRQPGVYAGCGATYNSNGELELSFGITSSSLSGMTIAIDPGHGYCKFEGVLDPGAVGYVREFDANVGIAKELESQLKTLGANVIRFKPESEFILTDSRPVLSRANGCDMYISIHANKVVGNSSVRGTEVYYFTPYSQPLAEAISAQVSDYFTNNVYSDGANKNRGAKYSYYRVTLQQDFPSVLVETAFVSNEEDALAIVDPEHQKNIASRIIKGIQSYLSRSDLSGVYNGSSTVENVLSFETEEPEDTEPSESTTSSDEEIGDEEIGEETVETEDEVSDTDSSEDDFFDVESTDSSSDMPSDDDIISGIFG